MSNSRYDLTIIGAGDGGFVSAIRGIQHVLRVTLINPQEPGGTCLHTWCIAQST